MSLSAILAAVVAALPGAFALFRIRGIKPGPKVDPLPEPPEPPKAA